MAEPSTRQEVFSSAEVQRLHQHQFGPWAKPFEHDTTLPQRMHPFTCPNRNDGKHFDNGADLGALIPTVRGWICQCCDYQQGWAHGFMADQPGDASGTEPIPNFALVPGQRIEFRYRNWEGKVEDRRVEVIEVQRGSTDWHPKVGWLLRATDLVKYQERLFAMGDMWNVRPVD